MHAWHIPGIATVASGSGIKGLVVGDTVRGIIDGEMDVVLVPDCNHLSHSKDFGFYKSLTEIGNHWKVLDVKDCCDLTYVLKGPLWLLCRYLIIKYYCNSSAPNDLLL